MTRTTVDIDRSILDETKALAKERGSTLGETISVLLAEALAAASKAKKRPPFRWISKPMGHPLVDLEDKDAVWAILDEGDHVGGEETDAHDC